MRNAAVEELLSDQRINAALAWVVVGALLLLALGSLLVGNVLWAGFALTVAALALVPPVSLRSARTMLP